MSTVEPSPWWLHDAARIGDIAEVRELLDAGVTVDYEYGLYGTALHEAAVFGHTKIATLLLDRGADVNGVGYDGMTPLDYAVCQPGNPELVTLLLDRGAELHERGAEALELSLAKAEERLAAAAAEVESIKKTMAAISSTR